ncbi:MAG: hypothetical protein AB8G11_06255 [Saprospiraceae bacterium]
MQNLTSVQRRLLSFLEQGKEVSKLGNKFYIEDSSTITKTFDISVSSFNRLIQNGIVKIVSGGKIILNQSLTNDY